MEHAEVPSVDPVAEASEELLARMDEFRTLVEGQASVNLIRDAERRVLEARRKSWRLKDDEAIAKYRERLHLQMQELAAQEEAGKRLLLLKPGDILVITNAGQNVNLREKEAIKSFFDQFDIKCLVFSEDIDMKIVRATNEARESEEDGQACSGSAAGQTSEPGHAVPPGVATDGHGVGTAHRGWDRDDGLGSGDSGTAGVSDDQ